MITSILLNFAYAFLNFLLGLLPNGNLPVAVASSVAYFWGVLNAYSFVVPVYTLLQAALVVLAFDTAMVLWYIINWIIRKIPGMQ